jgi:hypothetical protein
VEVVGQADHAVADDAESALCASEDACDDLVQGRARAQEKAGLEGADGDFDEGTAFWDEAYRSHAP